MSVTTRFVSVMSKKALLADAIFGLLGAAACALIGKAMIIGFAVGLIIGVFNQYLYFSAAGKTASLPPDKAAAYVVSRFYARFFISTITLAAAMWKFSSGAWAVLTGFTFIFLITITTAAIAFKEGIGKSCTE